MSSSNALGALRRFQVSASCALVVLAVVAFSLAVALFAPRAALAATMDAGTAASASLQTAITVSDNDVAAGDVSDAPATPAKVQVQAQAKINSKGWLEPVSSGKIVGVTTKPLQAFKLSLVLPEGVKGHVRYRTYDAGKGWGTTVKDGESSGRPSRAVQGVKIWLTGSVSSQYDIKYRAYVKGSGWRHWVRNKAVAGVTTGKQRVSAIQVKVVVKPKSLLNGIDIASWQQGLNPAKVDADFIIVKSTEGTWYTNPYFRKWADATLASGKLLGSYHFASVGDAKSQADYFVDTVGDYLGSCVLFLDWEASAIEQGPQWAKKFMNRVYKRTGIRPLIYMSKSVCNNWDWSSVASSYGLWVAQYSYAYQNKGTGYLADPWTDDNGYGAWGAPTLYQYTSNGWISGFDRNLDLNLFYGSASNWKKLAKKS